MNEYECRPLEREETKQMLMSLSLNTVVMNQSIKSDKLSEKDRKRVYGIIEGNKKARQNIYNCFADRVPLSEKEWQYIQEREAENEEYSKDKNKTHILHLVRKSYIQSCSEEIKKGISYFGELIDECDKYL